MNYATITFLCFLLAVGILYFAVPRRLQWSILLIASLTFYIFSCGTKIVFLLLAAAVLYTAALILDHFDRRFMLQKKALDKADRKLLQQKTNRCKKTVVLISVLLTLLMLLGTKYFNFFGSIINTAGRLWHHDQLFPVLTIMMPLGISYYTLMGISYIVDVYRGTAKAEKNPLMLLLFLCYFPHIVEGPFDRYEALSQQFRTPHPICYDNLKNGGIRFVWGLFKKIIIADRAGLIVNTIFSDLSLYSGSVQGFAVLLYTLQIYAEFSGCMDMVCGASQMFGIKIAENFRHPFFSRSISEFWRRWHITLGTWLKDYVFYPVSLSGHFKHINKMIRTHIRSKHFLMLLPSAYALFFVWFCNGLWHGASGKYIFYGLYYYLLMMLGQILKPVTEKLLQSLSITKDAAWYHFLEIVRTCIIVCFGMMIFRSASLSQAWKIFANIFTSFHISGLFDGTLLLKGVSAGDYLILLIAFLILLTVSLLEERGVDLRELLSRQILPLRWSLYLILLFSIIIFGAYGGNFTNTTFIYGEF